MPTTTMNPHKDLVAKAAAAIANNRAMKRGAPAVSNVLELLARAAPDLLAEVESDARAVLEAIMTIKEVDKTQRGFEIVHFVDSYGIDCSLQQSSAVLGEDESALENPGSSAIWLGPDEPHPQLLHGAATKLGIKHNATSGWVDYPMPEEVICNTRMHLNRKQVKQLIVKLTKWWNHGTFDEDMKLE